MATAFGSPQPQVATQNANNNTPTHDSGLGLGNQSMSTAGDHTVSQAGNDGISSLTWSPTANFLVSTNWDSGVRCWEVQEQNRQIISQPKAQVNHENNSPVLCSTFSADGSTVFTGGADNAVRMWTLGQTPPNNLPQKIGVHTSPVKSVAFISSTNLVVSGGWDKFLKFWDARQPNPVGQIELPDKCHDLNVVNSLLVVACNGRHVISYDVSKEPREHSKKESPLKFQSRCIAAFPDMTGFAVGSIEGRVGVHYLQKVPGKESFAFKCHRQDTHAYSVNSICFHPHFGTFATVGSDGVVNFWDKDNKQRLKGFPAINRTISCAAFNNGQGNMFAYSSSYDWSKGSSFYSPNAPNAANQNEIFIHYTPEDEIKPKGKKKK
mmetsp:Transcript_21082/g.24268  ORF Transcript_21082/g.24268 Transcript_21082/m.24268 type:complete len:379 (+) Transcript_21082:235-1371(+)